MRKNSLFGLSALIGTMVGAGIFGIPYAINKSGIVPGFFYFLILGAGVTLIHLFLAEVVLRTKENYRLIGFSQKYLGNWAKNLMLVSVVLGVIGALLAYLILGGEFLKIIFSSFNISSFSFTLIFWLFLSYFVFRGIKLIAPAALFTNFLFFSVIIVVFSFCFPRFNLSNLPIINLSNVFLPYGVILFSLVGWSAIPEINEILKKPEEKKEIKKIIILSSVVVIVLYLLFALSIIGVAGKNVSVDALSGLIPFLGYKIIFLGVLAGLITLIDSFLVLALYLKNSLICDLKISKRIAFLISCGMPFLLFLLGFRSFIQTIGFVGTIIGVVEGVMIILIFRKAKLLGNREPEYSLKIPSVFLYCLILIFILGALFQIF